MGSLRHLAIELPWRALLYEIGRITDAGRFRGVQMSIRHTSILIAPPPKVSVVIVNWNRLDDVLFNLQYLRKQTYPNIEVIVVDNGSTDGSTDRLSQIKGIRLVCLPNNAGPSKARNAGFRIARGKYVLLLDSDAVLAKQSLVNLVARMEADPTIGAAGCKILNWHTRRIDQWIYAQSYSTHADQTFDTYSFSAAGVLIRNDVLRKVGGFWERLFIYNEEVDLSIRILRAGYRIIYAPTARVFHRPSGNGRAGSATYFRYQIRNWIWIFHRHYPRWICWWKVASYSAIYLVKGLANHQMAACAKGIVEGVRQCPADFEFEEKMSFGQARLIGSLNRRFNLRLWNLATVGGPRPQRRRAINLSQSQRIGSDDSIDQDDLLPVVGR